MIHVEHLMDFERDEENRELRYVDPNEDFDGFGEPAVRQRFFESGDSFGECVKS